MSSFVQEIAPIIQRLAPEYGIRCCSAIIAQAILESGWGKSTLAAKHHNYFGIKCGTAWTGASVNMSTKEEYAPGVVTDIRDNFRAYPSMEDGIRGYFELIQLPRYQNLRGITDPREYLQTIKTDGYCTSSTYVDSCMRLVEQNDLTEYDGGRAMPSIQEFVRLMRYWCDEGNLGYDQSNRWDIRVGGECDCSSLVIFCLKQAGFDVGSASYTGNLSENLVRRGWKRLPASTAPQVGDILLNDAHHVAVCTAPGMMSYASIDENGRISGGQAGDQTDRETLTVSGFNYSRGWDCILRYEGTTSSSTPTTTTTGGKRVHNFGTVRRGSTGDAVKLLQSALNLRANAGLSVDGKAGALTEKAIRNWQRSHGLEDDGICGQNTWNSLLAA